MSAYVTTAVLLRGVEYGEHDLIVTWFTRAAGKVSTLAKNAKKSTRRFGGALDLFSLCEIVYGFGKRGRLPILHEALSKKPFAFIREDVVRTAYASYWTEMVALWMEEGQPAEECFDLLEFVLDGLDRDGAPEDLHLLFQLRFLRMAGFMPNLSSCVACGGFLENMAGQGIGFDVPRGGILCAACTTPDKEAGLGVGVVRQLLWMAEKDLLLATRTRFRPGAAQRCLAVLEAFVPYHLGAEPRSLGFIRQMRRRGAMNKAG
ncbi:MAG: DNA repair protein RecO [Desulfatibacillaceae bacterium]